MKDRTPRAARNSRPRTTTRQKPAAKPTPRPRRRTQDERSAETRSKLINAAIDIICRRGYASLTTAEVATAANVSRGALQHQFYTRDDLLVAVIDQLTLQMTLQEEIGAIADLPLDKRIDAVIRHYSAVYENRNFLAVLNIYLGVKDSDYMTGRLRNHIINIYEKSNTPWLDIFRDTKIPRAKLTSLRYLTLATLRGLAVARFLGLSSEPAEPNIRLLSAMLLQHMTEPAAKSEA